MSERSKRNPFRAILFDLGNTLLYFTGDWAQVFAEADQKLLEQLLASGLELDEAYFLKEFRDRMNTYYREREDNFIELTTAYILRNLLASLGKPTSDEIVCPALQAMYAASQQYWLPAEDTLSTLGILKEQGYRMGIISNAGDDADVQTLVEDADMRLFFDFILSSAAFGLRKPNPEIFEVALGHWDFANEEVVMVGDTLDADVLGANNLGIYSVWITRNANTPANRSNKEHIIPDAKISTLGQLPEVLKTARE
ncbi:MAG: HAD family hydrolase [Anaerolineales bacterium]|nr:HAD family hydrolase [Anaerolineales bacterium]